MRHTTHSMMICLDADFTEGSEHHSHEFKKQYLKQYLYGAFTARREHPSIYTSVEKNLLSTFQDTSAPHTWGVTTSWLVISFYTRSSLLASTLFWRNSITHGCKIAWYEMEPYGHKKIH